MDSSGDPRDTFRYTDRLRHESLLYGWRLPDDDTIAADMDRFQRMMEELNERESGGCAVRGTKRKDDI